MSKRKSRSKPKRRFFHILFWVLVAAAGLWVAYAPTPRRVKPAPMHVHVEPAPAAPILPPPAPDQVPETAAPSPGVGDEKASVETVAPLIPPMQEHVVKPPLVASGHPRIAVILDDVGLDLPGARRATKLPGFITLSFMPYAEHLKEQTSAAHDAGHELMLHMPMEPMGHEDPGPGALFVNLPSDEIRRRFDAALSSFSGFDGVNNHMGSKFTADRTGMAVVIGELEGKDLFFLDSRTNAKTVAEGIARERGVPTIARDVFLDDDLSPRAIRAQMEQAERVAQKKGHAVVIGHPHPTTLDALSAWIPAAEARGFVFVPVHDFLH